MFVRTLRRESASAFGKSGVVTTWAERRWFVCVVSVCFGKDDSSSRLGAAFPIHGVLPDLETR